MPAQAARSRGAAASSFIVAVAAAAGRKNGLGIVGIAERRCRWTGDPCGRRPAEFEKDRRLKFI